MSDEPRISDPIDRSAAERAVHLPDDGIEWEWDAEGVDEDEWRDEPEPDREMECDRCEGHPLRTVVRTTVAEAHRDPTQVYHLDCGHAVL